MKNIQLLAFLLILQSCQTSEKIPADLIFKNGTIITMEDDNHQAEFVAVKDGKILAVGGSDLASEYGNDSTQVIDLKGNTLLPGFVDAHSHFMHAMRLAHNADLSSPPVSDVENIGDMVEKLKNYQTDRQISKGDWIIGWGYDPDLLEEKRHPEKTDLDVVFPDNPVFLLHVSGHMAVVNSRALAIAKIDENTDNPEGGMIVRLPDSNEPSGLLQEVALYHFLPLLPKPTAEQSFHLLNETLKLYAAHGITTAQEGRAEFDAFEFLKTASEKEKLMIDINCLGQMELAKKFMQLPDIQFNKNKNGLNLAGLKMVGDGSPQGKTAFFTKSYLTPVPGCQHDCKGFANFSQTQLNNWVRMCYKNNIQLFAHANGDASIDMLLEAHEAATDSLNIEGKDLRSTVIHSQFVRPDQLDKYAELGFIPSFFTNHAFYWGDVHLENLGEERANFLSPLKTATEKGIIYTNHTDYIITPIDQLFLLWTAVNRTSRSGKIIGEAERISPWEGLKAITINAAYQHREEDVKGSIKVGKLADFVILDDNPLEVEADKIKDIQVLKTIKEGVVVFER